VLAHHGQARLQRGQAACGQARAACGGLGGGSGGLGGGEPAAQRAGGSWAWAAAMTWRGYQAAAAAAKRAQTSRCTSLAGVAAEPQPCALPPTRDEAQEAALVRAVHLSQHFQQRAHGAALRRRQGGRGGGGVSRVGTTARAALREGMLPHHRAGST
jgi:hypothetical protein